MRIFALALMLLAAPFSALRDRWGRVGTPDFEVYTNAGDKAAREALENFQQVRGFFLKASPLPLYDQFPVRIVLFKNLDQLREYTRNEQRTAYFVASPRRDYILMADSPDEYKTAIHEYMHLIVRHSGLRLPTWLNEGWAEVYSTLRPVADGVAVGDLIDGRLHELLVGQWMEIGQLTSIDPESPAYRGNGAETQMFYAESWALAHMLFLAPDYADGFPKFLAAIHRGKNFDQSCQDAFGKSAAEVFADLKKYFERKKMYGRVFKAPLGKAAPSVEMSKVDPFDSRLMLADLLAAIGRHAEAREEYAALRDLQPNGFELADSLGYLAIAERDAPAALREFDRAFAAGDADPRMCFQLAMLEHEAHRADVQTIGALERAIQSKPGYTDALLQLGLIQIAARDYRSGVTTLMKIEKIGPEQATPVFSGLAYGNLELGDLVRARKDAETANRYARSPDEVRRIAEMVSLIDSRSKSAFPPQPGEKIIRTEGALRQIDCSPRGNRMTLTIGNRLLVLDMPESSAVEFVHQGAATVQVACGPQKPVWITVEYTPSSVVDQATAGVLRRLEY